MTDVKAEIFREKLIIIARGVPVNPLTEAARAMANAGVRLLESTFDHALKHPIADNAEKIAALCRAMGGRMLIGAGTVLSEDEAQAAFDAGARYVIAPNTNPRVVARAQKLGMPVIPGAYTPTEICAAWDLGADLVKLFPADDAGLHYLQNVRAPLAHIPLMVTGGVNPATIPPFLAAGVAAVGTGVTVLRRDLLERGDFAGIGTLAKMHVDAVRLAQALGRRQHENYRREGPDDGRLPHQLDVHQGGNGRGIARLGRGEPRHAGEGAGRLRGGSQAPCGGP